MEKKVLKNKQVVIGLIILLILAVWLTVVFLPTRGRIGDLNKQLVKLHQKEKEAVPRAEIEMVEGLIDSLSARLQTQRMRIYPESALLDLGKAIDKIGRQYNLKLQDITPDYNSLSSLRGGTGELSELSITIEFKGLFSNFTRFLDNIEDFPFAMRANEVVLEMENLKERELIIQLQGVIILRKEREKENDKKNLMNA